MTLNEIKTAIANGNTVYWKQSNYQVIQDSLGHYLILCLNNDYCTGLYGQDGILNGNESDFYIAD